MIVSLMHVKTHFSIKDLEQLSGVKAHTIRIWEKRYNLLSPKRSSTNIRSYSSSSLQKLLNVTYLYRDGYKISKIAKLPNTEISKMVKQRDVSKKESYALENLKFAMLTFDTTLFDKTVNDLLQDRSFSEIYASTFIPFLNEIGMLWQTFSIDPTHERFISELIKQKIIVHTDTLKSAVPADQSTQFALFLPYNEIHEIGLLYANYELVKKGLSSIYLGTNIPLNSLSHVTSQYPNTVFITYVTMKPQDMDINTYIKTFNNVVANNVFVSLWLIGNKSTDLDPDLLSDNIKTLSTVDSLNKLLENYNHPRQ